VDPTIVEGLYPKPGGYYFNRNVLYKRSKLRNSVYVFGQVMNIQEIGHESISLDEFLEATHPVSGVSIYPVNTISTIRGNGTNMFGAYSPSFYNKLIIKPFWWIRTVDLNATFEDQFERIWECTVWGWTFGQMGGINLWDVTEESFYEDFMKWVYNGIKVYPDDYPYNMVLREEVGSKLRALNANFDSDMWENDIQWLLWNIFKFARDSIGSVEGTFPSDALSDIRNVWYTAVSYFTPCSTELYSKFYKEPLDTTDEDVIVRNFPYGELDYSNSIKKFFFPVDIWHGKVLVHPDGHCSAFYKDSLICGKDYVQNYTIFNYEPRFLIDVPGGNILVPYTMSLDLQTYADPGTDAFALFDTMVVDYISFWDGEIETTHNALYNTAYNHDFSLDSYWPQLEIAKKSHGECGITQDGRYTPMHYINSYFFIVPSVNGISFDSTPGCISATRLSAAFT
jgi:hypothetical protein